MSRRNHTAHAALVLLSMGEASGYELKQRADATLRFFFNAPAMSQLYAELDRLCDAGLVEDRLETRSETADRETRVFRLTSAGRRRLGEWVGDDPLPTTVFKSHLALRLLVGHLAEPDLVRGHLAVERARVERDLVDLTAVHEMLDPAHDELGWAWLVAEWGSQYYRDMLAQLDTLRDNLDVLVASRARTAT